MASHLARCAMIFIACVSLFPYGFFIVQALRQTIGWSKALLNTCVLLLAHVTACSVILMSYNGYPLMVHKAGFILAAMTIWLGYDWQTKSMTSSNGYADWQRALRWIGVFLKILAIGAVLIQFGGH